MSKTDLTSLKRIVDTPKHENTKKRKSRKEEKQKMTFMLPGDVVEYLALNKARKKGNMSEQVTRLVREAIAQGE